MAKGKAEAAKSPVSLGHVILWLLLSLLLIWTMYVLHRHSWRLTLLTCLAGAAFVTGSLIGFIFTTYGDEANTIGKVKDWIVGVLAGVTIAKISSLHAVLSVFALTNTAADYALCLSLSLVFASLGFYFMFFGRELFFNVPLAIKRSQRFIIETTHQAGLITIQLNTLLPSSVLIGIADAQALLLDDPVKAAALKAALESPEVEQFMDECEKSIKAGQALDWDVISKAANLQYYRSYAVDADKQTLQQEAALEWITRALILNPDHVDLTVKRADVLALLKNYPETVSVLEQLYTSVECPVYIEQWLGYYLLWIPGREDQAIQCNSLYLQRFPDSKEAFINLTSAYAQKTCLTARRGRHKLDVHSQDYKTAIHNLKIIVRDYPDHLPKIRDEWTEPGGSFSCFAADTEYLDIIAADEDTDGTESSTPPPPTQKKS